MKPITTSFLRFTAFVALAAFANAQEPQPVGPPPDQQQQSTGGWRRVGEGAPAAQAGTQSQIPDPNYPDDSQAQAPPPQQAPSAEAQAQYPPPQVQYPRPQYPQQNRYPQQAPPPAQNRYPMSQQQYPQPQPNYGPVPAEITLRPGTYLTVRVDQPLSSDRNHAGDGFTATLTKPLVVDGVVIAQAGQTLGGRVTEAVKAGRVQGTSRLGVELIDLGLVDGQQVPLKTSFVAISGNTSIGQDAAALATTTGLGAAIGAAANGGVGAGVGAGAGAAVGLIGILLTRGHATVLYPEEILTFRVEAPLTVNTTRSQQAFRYVQPEEYQRAAVTQQRYAVRRPAPAPGYYGYGYPYYGPGYWGLGYPYYPYWGPSFGFYYGGRGYYGRGWRR